MMHPIPGGAAAKPFVTHHEALDMDLFMRIAPELYLKRLLVGGFDRVYEIGRAFRNEGIDTRHNPEFTILEAYQAYTDYVGMMDLVEEIIQKTAFIVEISLKDKNIEMLELLKKPFSRCSLDELFLKHLNMNYYELCQKNSWREVAFSLNLSIPADMPDHKCFEKIFDEKLLPHLPKVAIVYDYPKAFSPLAKSRDDAPFIADRFELFFNGEEIANAYSEQNDPEIQRDCFMDQAKKKQAGDEEAMPVDEEYLIALEYGMPPAGGLGIGIDRLVMHLTNTPSIREVILFPLLRPESST
jgi:lysyl-tRNA synthetase class 2